MNKWYVQASITVILGAITAHLLTRAVFGSFHHTIAWIACNLIWTIPITLFCNWIHKSFRKGAG